MAVVVTNDIVEFAADENGSEVAKALITTEVPEGVKDAIRGLTVAAWGQSEVWVDISEDGGDTWETKLSVLLPAEGTLHFTLPTPLRIDGEQEDETVLTQWRVSFAQPAAQPIRITVFISRESYA